MHRFVMVPGLLAALLLHLLPAPVHGALYSNLWGRNGELWDPKGPLPDFSYAGYKQGNEPLPVPPVTRSVLTFRKAGMSDTKMFKAALAWAHSQPVTDEFIVLFVPAGRYTLTERLWIKRSRLVLRGAGSANTVLYIPKSLTDIYGANPNSPAAGAYVNTDAFIAIKGASARGAQLTRVTKSAAKGDVWVQVDKPSKLIVGQLYDMWFTDVRGKFNNHMFDNLWKAPAKYAGTTRAKLTTRVLAIRGKRVKIERYLPYDIRVGLNIVNLHALPDTLADSGIEGLTFSFKWSWYAGHHLEKGWNAVEVTDSRDCWVRDIHTINADNSVTMNGVTSSTVTGVRISASKTRANKIPNRFNERADRDGHWGVEYAHSFDIMVTGVDVRCQLMHSVGTDSSGKWGVFMNSKMADGNLDLHRALAGPTLYTNIDVGIGTRALYSGGPSTSGPNALAGTTWWTIKSRKAVEPNDSDAKPGACSFGPAINLVGVNIIPSKVSSMCRTWHYERAVSSPANLYKAQLKRRKARAALASR
ncbi:hypothetical protein D9Q98_005458 [Chlorella vulgaris]|uniref:Pectate lyase superfamily protein domain-containing protein n=1 Tax=Chlorella vulgaris TaxID=3077 RepID=A0A9D4TLY6_CHLVU|nr:hypothetical protein D9Q98_005458 [Chlorella vulgaris]